ncbi:MAG: 1-acyl-sn-glycerol-3-phosphate acyltransferase [Deltaproteobacteria bacterium]|nr:1-acyl-sn-glycerol-3-phosphate acyltransferase [Deltaproteobacteria bacterium]
MYNQRYQFTFRRVWAIMTLILGTLAIGCIILFVSVVDRNGNKCHKLAQLWGRLIGLAAGIDVRLEGLENIDPEQSYVYASNHQSALDIIVLQGYLPVQFRWLAKKELFDIPCFGKFMASTGYIPIDRGNKKSAMQSLDLAAEKVQQGTSVIIFPEGTRSLDGQLLPFKPGGFLLAIKSQRPIVPVGISGSARVLPGKSLRLRPGWIKVALGRPIETAGLSYKQRYEVADLVKAAILEKIDKNYL